MTLDELTEKAGTILTAYGDASHLLFQPVLLKDQPRACLVRCQIATRERPCENVGTIIVRHIRDEARGFSDWAALEFLSSCDAARGLHPRFLGGDVETRLLLMEDLGGSRCLEDVLRDPDAGVAQQTLNTMARAMARFHVATKMGERAFDAVRSALPVSQELDRKSEARRWRESESKMRDWLSATGCVVPFGLSGCLDRIADTYEDPGPFLTFTHGDPAPTNNHVAGTDAVRLLDFEYAAFRHVLYDITAWNILCPLPVSVVRAMRESFRWELIPSFPEAADEAIYMKAWGYICAYRALAILTWISPEVLTANRPFADDAWTGRHAVLAAMARLTGATENVAGLAPVYELAANLESTCRARWSEFDGIGEVITDWPALRSLAVENA